MPRAPVGSFAGLIYELWAVPPPGAAELLCLVTAVANGHEQRGTRRRSVRPTVRGWPGPSANAPDALPRHERRLEAEITKRYGPGRTLAEVSEAWRPYRTWAAVHLRALREQQRTGETAGRQAIRSARTRSVNMP